MTAEELKHIIDGGESLEVEFKSADANDRELIEEIVCMANGRGGWLLLGVEDDGSITGLKQDGRGPFNPHHFAGMVAGRTQPPLHVEVYPVEVDDVQVVAINVPAGGWVYGTSDGKYLYRLPGANGPECKPMSPQEVASRLSSLGVYDLSAQPVPGATWSDLDPLEWERLRQTIDRNPGADKNLLQDSDEQIALSLGLAVWHEDQLIPTVTGLLLVGREEALRTHLWAHEAAFQVTGTRLQMRKNDFFREPLIKLFERFTEILAAHNPTEEFRAGLFRLDVPQYPSEAFREALANALAHRDYAKQNAVYVQIDEERQRLTIISPGGFVQGVSPENLLSIGPRPRNRTLADALKRIGIVERRGRGVERIYREVLGIGRPPPDYSRSGADEVRVDIYGGPADEAFLLLVATAQDRAGRLLNSGELLLLWYIRELGELEIREAAHQIQQGEAEARRMLKSLEGLGLVEAKGHSRNRTYHLSSWAAASLDEREKYILRRGLEREKIKAHVVEYAKEYGAVRRSNVLKLYPHLSKRQATYLLEELVREGQLEARGHKGGKHYVVAR